MRCGGGGGDADEEESEPRVRRFACSNFPQIESSEDFANRFLFAAKACAQNGDRLDAPRPLPALGAVAPPLLAAAHGPDAAATRPPDVAGGGPRRMGAFAPQPQPDNAGAAAVPLAAQTAAGQPPAGRRLGAEPLEQRRSRCRRRVGRGGSRRARRRPRTTARRRRAAGGRVAGRGSSRWGPRGRGARALPGKQSGSAMAARRDQERMELGRRAYGGGGVHEVAPTGAKITGAPGDGASARKEGAKVARHVTGRLPRICAQAGTQQVAPRGRDGAGGPLAGAQGPERARRGDVGRRGVAGGVLVARAGAEGAQHERAPAAR